MMNAKRMIVIIAMAFMLGTSTISVMAHGSEHKTKTTYSQCTKSNCSKTGVHTHGEKKYCGNKTIKSSSTHKSSCGNKSCH
jgi:hypothetical protein